MKPLLVSEIRKIIHGELIQGSNDLKITDAVYHLEKMKNTNKLLFLDSRRRRVNWDVIRNCVPCAVVTDMVSKQLKTINGCTIIKVENIQTAYWAFVEYYRSLFQIPVIAVTGTSGKTTTKDMIKHILKYSCKVHGTNASANSRTYHLTYLLGIEESTEAAVFETAVGKPGDVANACRYFRPMIGIITNIGVTHLDGCKTAEAYIHAKADMINVVNENGILLLNVDDENTKKVNLGQCRGRIVYFGIHNPCDFQASNVKYGKNGMNFDLAFNHMNYKAFVPGYGEHQVYNALAAAAAVYELGIGINEAIERLRTFKKLPAHLQLLNGIKGCQILDDTWNSNPLSLKAAFKALNGIAKGRKRVALIGDIKALGDISSEIHRQVGDMITEVGVDILVTFGSSAEEIARQASKKELIGLIRTFSDIKEVYEYLENILDQNTIMLVKCSSKDLPIINLTRSLAVR
jgi:UDP-N-acetylmuramoyl-tripeptide--D-alanyl-D-alanine ligase